MNYKLYEKSPSAALELLGITSYTSDAFKESLEAIGYTVQQQDSLCDDEFCYYLVNDGEEKLVFVSGETEDARCFYYSILLGLMYLSDSRDADESQMINAYMFAAEIKKLLQVKEASKTSIVKLRSIYMRIFAVFVTLSTVTLLFLLKTVNKVNINPLDSLTAVISSELVDLTVSDAFAESEANSFVMPDMPTEPSEPTEPTELTELSEPTELSEKQTVYSSVSKAVSNIVDNEAISFQSAPAQSESLDKFTVGFIGGEYYATSSGKKYHISSCQYIKDLSKCIKLSNSDISSGKYEPCKKCIK